RHCHGTGWHARRRRQHRALSGRRGAYVHHRPAFRGRWISMELLSSSCAPTESPLKELNIGFAPFVLKSPISLMTETLRLGPLEHVPRCELRDTSIAVKPITVRQRAAPLSRANIRRHCRERRQSRPCCKHSNRRDVVTSNPGYSKYDGTERRQFRSGSTSHG